MSRLIISTAMTVDAVISVEDWYVPEGKHDRAGLEQFDRAAADEEVRAVTPSHAVLLDRERELEQEATPTDVRERELPDFSWRLWRA